MTTFEDKRAAATLLPRLATGKVTPNEVFLSFPWKLPDLPVFVDHGPVVLDSRKVCGSELHQVKIV